MSNDPIDQAQRLADRLMAARRAAAALNWKNRLAEHVVSLIERNDTISLDGMIEAVEAAMAGKSEESLDFIENAPVLDHLLALRSNRQKA